MACNSTTPLADEVDKAIVEAEVQHLLMPTALLRKLPDRIRAIERQCCALRDTLVRVEQERAAATTDRDAAREQAGQFRNAHAAARNERDAALAGCDRAKGERDAANRMTKAARSLLREVLEAMDAVVSTGNLSGPYRRHIEPLRAEIVRYAEAKEATDANS